MERYDYHQAVYDDVLSYIQDNDYVFNNVEDIDSFKETLEEYLWTSDSVTGNGSGSYTFNAWEAEENLCHNWDLIDEVAEEFGEFKNHDPESIDVSIRCYLLSQCIEEVCESEEFETLWNKHIESLKDEED